VHAVSEELVDALVAFGVPREKVECFPVGVDLSIFRPSAQPRDPHRVPTIICTRKHEAVYENHVLVDALATLEGRGIEYRALFVGGGSLLEETRSRVRERGLGQRVEVRGPVPHEQIPSLLAGSDIYVSASSSDGTSSSLLEALACGLFPVVSQIRANADWVRDGATGYLFPPGDSERLAKALEMVLGDGPSRLGVGAANRALVAERGSMESNLLRLETLLKTSS
jgi:glycosyltransferase involved in cell wall biosynthesis